MAFNFNNFKKKTEDLAQKGADWAQLGVNKATQVASVAKLKAANIGEEETIRKAYAELGRRYYVAHSAAPEVEFVDVVQQIEDAKKNILENNVKIADLKAKADLPSDDIVFEMDVEDLPTQPTEAPEAKTAESASEQPAPEAPKDEQKFGE